MNGREENELTTDGEVPRRLAKMEEALLQVSQSVGAYDKKIQDHVAGCPARQTVRYIDPMAPLAVILAILAVTAIEVVALMKGADGAMLLPVVGVVAALGGLKMRDIAGLIERGRSPRDE